RASGLARPGRRARRWAQLPALPRLCTGPSPVQSPTPPFQAAPQAPKPPTPAAGAAAAADYPGASDPAPPASVSGRDSVGSGTPPRIRPAPGAPDRPHALAPVLGSGSNGTTHTSREPAKT